MGIKPITVVVISPSRKPGLTLPSVSGQLSLHSQSCTSDKARGKAACTFRGHNSAALRKSLWKPLQKPPPTYGKRETAVLPTEQVFSHFLF